ncbi:hypothetical protein NQ315_009541 [Exocentrus adspersus]|uniref:Uncharacterized protein n=1 Tax=Exocentrus adspersus TaxID=1586481 RepID=A0AAV8WGN5_9CUCU|nr:hypothetical protein NQ315_009541 [Exocentrus adspersus]
MRLLFILCIVYNLNFTYGWDSEQLEVFDVVDEVKQNFYELLNISKDASSAEIRSAFRGLSLKLHPDKNLEEDTSEQFRNLVSVYEVLRSPSKRKYYDDVLVNGLPNWRSGLFYYRYVRKMGMTEAVIILFIICTVGQYLVNWGAYFEKKFTIQEQLRSKRKQGRKAKTEVEPEIILPKPSIRDTLPIQIPRLIWHTILSVPMALGMIKTAVEQKIEEVNRPPTPEPEPVPTRIKTVRKRNKFVVPEGPNFEIPSTNTNTETGTSSTSPPPMSGGLWTDDDLAELIRLVKKYPQGSSRRWESIAEALGRSVPEVTYMSNKMKENGYKMPSEQEEEVQVKVKQKTKKEVDTSDEVKNWNQIHQRALEDALARFPKGCTDRWDRIAEHVPDKSKEECMLRFRYLAENLKKQRQPVDKTEKTEENIDIGVKSEDKDFVQDDV